MKIKVERAAKRVMSARVKKAHDKKIAEAVANIVCFLDDLEDPLDVALVLATVCKDIEYWSGVSDEDINRVALMIKARDQLSN